MFDVPVSFCADLVNKTEEERIKIMEEFASCGAKHLVLTCSLIDMILAKESMADILKKEMAGAGLTFVDAHAPFRGIYDLIYDGHRRDETVLRHRLHLKICREMGVDTLAFHIGNDALYTHNSYKQNHDNICRMIEELLPEAEACGVTMCIENIWGRPNITPALFEIKNKFPSEYLGFCFDSGHAHLIENGWRFEENAVHERWELVGEKPNWQKDVVTDMLPQIVNCHLHDNIGQFDTHLLPGEGTIDWKHVVSSLKKAPRLKNIQCEISSRDRSIKQLVDKLNELGELE